MSIIAENTRRIIKERGLKIGAVGKQAGYQGKTFYNLLSGEKVITDRDIQAIAHVLKVKARAEQAEKDAAAQLDAYKFDTWFDGLAAQYHARNGAVIRTLAGEDRMKALRESKNRDEDGKALFEDLTKNSAYAFEDQTPPPPPYAGGTGGSPVTASDAAMRAAMGLPVNKK